MKKEAVLPTREKALTLLLKSGKRSAGELASSLGVSVQVMRRHLRILEETGLVEAHSIPVGRGRPSNSWQLTEQGQNHFNNGNQIFTLDLLTSMEATFSKEKLEELWSNQLSRKVKYYRNQIGQGNIAERIKKLIQLRSDEGYLADYKKDSKGQGWYINAFHCSISKIAEDHPFICDQELEIIRLSFPDCTVSRIEWRINGGHTCGFHILPYKHVM